MELERLWNLVGKKIIGRATEQELQEILDLLQKDPDVHFSIQIIARNWSTAAHQNKHCTRPPFTDHWRQITEQAIACKYESMGLSPRNSQLIWNREINGLSKTPEGFMEKFVSKNYFDVAWKSLMRYNVYIAGLLGLASTFNK